MVIASNNLEMKTSTTAFALIYLLVLGTLSSCIHTDYYEPTPTPVGYQYAFNDDFNNNANRWAFDDNGNDAHVAIVNGVLKYTYYPLNQGTNTVAVSTGLRMQRDFLIQTRVKSNNAIALVFGLGGGEYGYSFFIDDQGYFAVYDEGNSRISAQALIDWTSSTAIRAGWNDVELEQVGSNWIGYVNGARIFSLPSRTMYGDQCGFMVLNNTTGFAEYLTAKW